MGLGQFHRLGNGKELTGGRDKDSILADTMEALIGATFLSNGDDAATELVLRLVRPLLGDAYRFGAARDPKTSLQERAAQLGPDAPVYVIVADGPDHARVFTATVSVGTLVAAEGVGSSKKHAEMAAALTAWNLLENA